MLGERANFGGFADRRGALFFDCLVREVAGEEADGAVVEGWWGWQGAGSAGGVEGVEVAEPGGEGEAGGGGLVTTAGEALEVAAEEGDLGEGKGEGADLLGAQAVLEGVEVAPGGAGAGSFAAPRHVSLLPVVVCGSMVGRAGERWKGEVAVGWGLLIEIFGFSFVVWGGCGGGGLVGADEGEVVAKGGKVGVG